MSAANGFAPDPALEPRRTRARSGEGAGRQGAETVMRHPAEIEPKRREPPPHLQGALRAAAAARDRAERIRGVEPAPAPASHPPAARPDTGAWSGPAPQADPPGGQPSETTRFARTFAAVQQVRAAIAAEDADLPLHLRLREEKDAPGRRTERWWSRLRKSLRARTRPAPDALRLPGPEAAGAAGAAAAPRPAGPTPAAVGRPHAPAASVRAAVERTAFASALPGAEPAPAGGEVLRLPPLGRGELACDAPSSALLDPPSAAPEVAGPDPERSARPQGGASLAARAEAGRAAPRDPLDRPWLAHRAARASEQFAWATRWRASWLGAADAGMAAAQTTRNLPVPYTGPGLPATRLADVLARPRRPSGDPRRDRAGPARGARRAASSAATALTALRSRSRWLMITGALAAGFALGIVAYGSSPLSGTRWGQAMLALEAGWFERTRSDGTAPAAVGGPSSIAELPAMALAPPAAGGRVDLGAERRSATNSMAAAAPRPAALPESPTAGRASAGLDPESGSDAIARGPIDFDLSSRATVATPATLQAAVAEWQSLYAEGHRFQLSGNLVAAADAYRRALRLNPEHPAIHYDLGYVLQMQGRAEAAIDHYRRAIALQPDHGYAHYNLGYLLQSLGETVAALEHYEIAATRLPGNAFVYYDWAWSLELSGDRAGAAALYRKAIALDPEDRPGIDARRRLAALGRSARLE